MPERLVSFEDRKAGALTLNRFFSTDIINSMCRTKRKEFTQVFDISNKPSKRCNFVDDRSSKLTNHNSVAPRHYGKTTDKSVSFHQPNWYPLTDKHLGQSSSSFSRERLSKRHATTPVPLRALLNLTVRPHNRLLWEHLEYNALYSVVASFSVASLLWWRIDRIPVWYQPYNLILLLFCILSYDVQFLKYPPSCSWS